MTRVMNQTEFKVDKPIELLPFLMEKYKGASRSKVKEILAHSVCVDGKKTSQFNYPLMTGMTVTIGVKKFKERFVPKDIDIVYEDQHLMVINKHEGLVSYSSKPADRTAISIVNQYFDSTHQQCRAHVVHRLDRDTSGLMLVAKSKEVSRKFEEDWKGLVYDRAYVAVVWGVLEEKEDTITSWLTDGRYCVLSSPTDNGGKKAVTHYMVKRRSRKFTLIELRLDTGRRNQIRVQMRELGHPVVHDPMYGYKEDAAPINRLALHAFRLCFVHPVTGKKLQFSTPYPSAFEKLMEVGK